MWAAGVAVAINSAVKPLIQQNTPVINNPLSYAVYLFLPDVIGDTVRLYYRFSLSLRMVDGLPATGGIDRTYESMQRWAVKYDRFRVPSLGERPVPSVSARPPVGTSANGRFPEVAPHPVQRPGTRRPAQIPWRRSICFSTRAHAIDRVGKTNTSNSSRRAACSMIAVKVEGSSEKQWNSDCRTVRSEGISGAAIPGGVSRLRCRISLARQSPSEQRASAHEPLVAPGQLRTRSRER